MDYKDRREVIDALHTISSNASTREGPEGFREYAEEYSLYMRDAHKALSDKGLCYDIREMVIQVTDDAGLSEEEAFQYWEKPAAKDK